MKKQSGFTIVELLIVIVVIGILAAITVVAFTGIQNRGYDASVRADLRNLAAKVEVYRVDASKYPETVAQLDPLNYKLTKASYAISPITATNMTYCYGQNGSDYGAIALSKSGKIFYMTAGDGNTVREYTSAWPANADDRCAPLAPTLLGGNRNYNAYSAIDTTTGPWRSWVGGQ